MAFEINFMIGDGNQKIISQFAQVELDDQGRAVPARRETEPQEPGPADGEGAVKMYVTTFRRARRAFATLVLVLSATACAETGNQNPLDGFLAALREANAVTKPAQP